MVHIELLGSDGRLLAERTLERMGSCADLAEAVAVVISTWEAEFRPNVATSVVLPPPASAPPPASPEVKVVHPPSVRPLCFDVGIGLLASRGAAGGFPVDGGVGGGVGGSGVVHSSGGSGGCGILCSLPVGGSGGNTADFPDPKNCGNGVIDIGEYCDDGNMLNGDGCTGCIIDPGWQCPVPGQPCMPRPPGVDTGSPIDAQGPPARGDAGVPVLPVHDAGPAATGPLSQGPTSWTGYIENYQFPSGSDVIRFTSTVDSAGQVKVTVFLGSGTPPPPATDPNVGYPPGLDPLPSNIGYWVEGFAYTMTSGTFQAQRLRFTIYSYQPWSGWCALQKPISGSDMCIPNWSGDCSQGPCIFQNPATGQTIQVDARKAELCMDHVCTCSTTACVYNTNSGTTASFDLAVAGRDADGSVVGLIGERANVHFILDPS
jgi:cysteine-rich repeat protein